MRRPLRNALLTSLLGACLALGATGISLADATVPTTNFVREFAKNKPPVYIVTSGPQADEAAQALRAAILKNPDNKHAEGEIRILSVKDAAAQAVGAGDFTTSPVVFLLVGPEMTETLPTALASLLPSPLPAPDDGRSVVSAALGGRKDHQVFAVLLYARDADRLGRLYDVLAARRSESFRTLPFTERYTPNRIAVFSSALNRDFAERWGVLKVPNVWNDIVWHDVAEADTLPADQLAERAQVFFLDRGHHDRIPAAAKSLLANTAVGPLTILTDRSAADPRTDPVIVFSAPSSLILARKAAHYPDVTLVAPGVESTDAADLRSLSTTALLVAGPMPPRDRETIRHLIAERMQKETGIAVQDRTDGVQGDVPFDRLQGTNDTTASLRRDLGLRYVWHFAVTGYTGRTEYHAEADRITPLPEPFTRPEPTPPSRRDLFSHRMSDDDYNRAMAKYQSDHDDWLAQKKRHDDQANSGSYSWKQSIARSSSAHVQGTLRLVDLGSANGKVVWESDCQADRSFEDTLREVVTPVAGPTATPKPLDTPPAEDTAAPSLMYSAAVRAARAAIEALQETALLPGSGDAGTPDDSAQDTAGTAPPPATQPAAPPTPRVADIQDGVATLTVGSGQGVAVGDLFAVPIQTRVIRDPATGAVLETRVLDQITLRVIRAGVTADCVPNTAADKAKFAKVQVGMDAQWSRKL